MLENRSKKMMKMLKFPEEVVQIAQNYLEYYECDEKGDAVVNDLSD